jgi:hypothetical protein
MPSVTRTIHFEKAQERYELTASPACIHLDGNGDQVETVTVRLMHYKGTDSEEITGKSVTVTDGANSANFTLPAEINQSGGTVISQSLDDREHGAPDSLTVIGILGANNLVIPVVHDGADGENAVTVQTSPEAILHKKATTSSQYSLAIRVWNGKTAVPASGFSAKIQSKPNGLSEYMIASATDSYINYLGISINANTEINGDITIAVTYNGNTYTKVVPFKTVVNGDPGIKGEKGATMRGPQNYTDLSDGYYFQAGKEGEEWKDVVIYNGSFYSCTVSHAKNATIDISGNTLSSDYWVVSSIQEIVATRVLLAANAFIKLASSNKIIVVNNNGVETGGMQGDTSSPIFWLKDPLTSASIEIGLNNDGTPYIKGREQGIESDNDSNYAFLLDPSKGTYDFYGPSNQRFLVNGDGLTYWDSGGRELEIDSNGGMTFFGQYVSFMRSTSGVIIPLDKFVVGKSKASSYGSWGGRKVYIDDKGYLRIHPDDDYEVYNNGSWTTVDKEHWES